MDEYYRILESLPPALRTPLAKLDAHYAPHIQEIRLRLGQPVQFTIRGRLCPAAEISARNGSACRVGDRHPAGLLSAALPPLGLRL